MTQITQVSLKPPYLVFIGDVSEPNYAKTAFGLIQWCSDLVAGQIRFIHNKLDLGVSDMTIQQAVDAGVKSIIIGVAPVGGSVCQKWIDVLVEAAEAGLDIVSGLHGKLESHPELVVAAGKSGSSLINVREPSNNLPIATAVKRKGKRLLMVGTDCAVGKKYTALSISRAMEEACLSATFRATGQTGIMIAGSGVPIDAVVADFIAGAAEVISPDNNDNHWDIIEGQGSLFNPSYSGVSMGLLHGSQPDAIVICHDPTRDFIGNCPSIPVPNIKECIALTLACGKIVNSEIKCIGVSVNTSSLDNHQREEYLRQLSEQTNLPCFDPLLEGCSSIVEQLRGN